MKELVSNGQKLSKKAAAKEHPDVLRYLRDWNKLKLKDNVLYRTVSIDGQQYDQLIVPKGITDTILHALHDDLGHQGRHRTAWLVKSRFFLAGNGQGHKE